MKFKALLLVAAISLTGVATSMAQTVFSVNAVGFVNKDVQPGFNLMANPLDNGSGNLLSELIPAPPFLTEVFVFNGTGYTGATYIGSWDNDLTLAPGEGFFIRNPDASSFSVTFVGEVPQNGDSNMSLSAGFSLLGSKVPQEGGLQSDLEYSPAFLDEVFTFDGSGYETFTFIGSWSPSEPQITVAQGFFIRKDAQGSWDRNFSIGDQ